MDFEMILWLMNRGASPYSKHEGTGGSGLHFLALGLQKLGIHHSLLRVEPSTKILLPTVVVQPHMRGDAQTDSCSCLCCPGGCTPFVPFLDKRSYYERDRDETLYSYKVKQSRLWESFSMTAGRMSPQLNAHLRLIAFERLGLRHTCCLLDQHGHNSLDWDRFYLCYSLIFTTHDMPRAEQKVLLDKELGIYNSRVKACHCPTFEKPLCNAFHQPCPTPPTVNKED